MLRRKKKDQYYPKPHSRIRRLWCYLGFEPDTVYEQLRWVEEDRDEMRHVLNKWKQQQIDRLEETYMAD